jgi:hypothetical protein
MLWIPVLLAAALATAALAAPGEWRPAVRPDALRGADSGPIRSGKVRWVSLADAGALVGHLAQARAVGSGVRGGELALPLPGGGTVDVELYAYDVVEDHATVPDLATFMLRSARDPSLRGSLTYVGGRVYASFTSREVAGGERVLVDPASWHGPGAPPDAYAVFLKRDYGAARGGHAHRCLNDAAHSPPLPLSPAPATARALATPPGASTFGSARRTLRLALSCTAQYGMTVTGLPPSDGNYVSAVTAAMVVALNRINEVYLNTFAMTFTLIAGNEALISRSTTDAISSYNGNALNLLYNNGNWILNVNGISSSAFDFGHVFATSPGGVAVIGSACNSDAETRCRAATGLSSPVGDPFYIDYVSHEMGHQFGAYHTFNGQAGNCAGNRVAAAAVEPGSGVSIMSYTGTCGADNVQTNSIAQFSWFSFMGMNAHITAACPAGTANPGAVAVTAQLPGFTVPRATPFMLALEANATADGAAMTYSIEEADVGTAATLADGDLGSNPLFRSYTAGPRPYRLFAPGPVGMLPATTARAINFRAAVYDNAPAGGHVAVGDQVIVTVNASIGPVVVTAPSSGQVVAAGSELALAWDVAGSDALSAGLCVFLADSADLTGGFGRCIGEIANVGSGSVTLPAAAKDGGALLRLAAGAPNFFYAAQTFTVTSGGAGLTADANCSAGCYPAQAVEAAPAAALAPPFFL